MSPPSPSSPLEGLNCKSCGRFVKYQACKSDKNGNKGVLFAICHGVNEDGKHCSFIRRASKSPSASPTIPSQPTFTGPTAVVTPTIPTEPPTAPTSGKCTVHNCSQTRLADDCPRRICRKHCIEQGGCTSKTHKHQPTTASLPGSLAVAAPPPSSTLPSPPSPSLLPSFATPPPFNREPFPIPNVVDAQSDPRFATHLRPIFTEAIAEQQERLRQSSILEVEHKTKAQKSKQRIAIYTWAIEDRTPIVKFFQDFTWPYLTITPSLLSAIGLLEASTQGDLRMYDELEIQDWVAVDEGYVMEVQEGQRLFLKDACLQTCVDFQKSLDTRSQSSTHHLYHHLARERAYVRETRNTKSPSFSPPQPLSPADLPSPLATALNAPTSTLPSHASSSRGSAGLIIDDPIDDDNSHSDSEVEIVEKHWPTNYFTVEIGNCLRECSSRTHRKHQVASTQRSVFIKHFPHVRFIPSTFSNQQDLWNKAPSSLRDEFMELGHCKEGLWAAFAKRARREQKGKAKADVIEID